MLKILLVTSALLSTLPVLAQRTKVTEATVFLDEAGQRISKKEFIQQSRSGQFTTGDIHSTGAVYTSFQLKRVGAPDKVRTQAMSAKRAFQTPAPAFPLTDIYGQAVSSADLCGKVVVLNFWYIKCGYCQLEMPKLKRIAAAYQTNPNVVFLSFATDQPEQLRQFIAQKGDFGFRILPLPRELGQQFDVRAYPTMAVLDKAGNYVYDKVGYTDNQLRLEEAIAHALK
jgi:peroxiredoxin